MREVPPDRHAATREERRLRARYGMRVSGRSVRLLDRLSRDQVRARNRKKKGR
ncbi:MAG: hypothetical protein QN198_10195 [Armatimonadota bacterium]|nr:hypothetical protein [Armatimonadota bacterium]